MCIICKEDLIVLLTLNFRTTHLKVKKRFGYAKIVDYILNFNLMTAIHCVKRCLHGSAFLIRW